MKKIGSIIIITIGLFVFISGGLFAQKHSEKKEKSVKIAKIHKNNRKKVAVVKTKQFPRNKVVVVKQRNIRTVPSLAVGYSTIPFRGKNYYYHNGHYYNQFNNNYTIIAPPRGLRIRFLPTGNRKILMGNVPHYYYMGTYYSAVGSRYQIVEPSIGTIVPNLPEDNVEEITIDG